jgi:hypothetical protein
MKEKYSVSEKRKKEVESTFTKAPIVIFERIKFKVEFFLYQVGPNKICFCQSNEISNPFGSGEALSPMVPKFTRPFIKAQTRERRKGIQKKGRGWRSSRAANISPIERY